MAMRSLNEAEFQQRAKATRERMLRIWDGDAKRADEYLCWIMRYYKDHSGDLPPEGRERVLEILAQLIQRER